MCRVTAIDYKQVERPTGLEYWRHWKSQKDESKELGKINSKTIKKIIKERIREVEMKSEEIRRKNEELQEVKEWLAQNNLNTGWSPVMALERIKAELKKEIPLDLMPNIDRTINNLKEWRDRLKEKHD